MGKLSRTKGHSFERLVSHQWQEMGWKDARTKRAARGGDWSTTDDGTDLVGTEPFAVQCKRYADYVPVRTIEEIVSRRMCPEPEPIGFARRTPEAACTTCGHLMQDHFDQIPLLLTKADNKPTMAVLPWEELRKLIKMAYSE